MAKKSANNPENKKRVAAAAAETLKGKELPWHDLDELACKVFPQIVAGEIDEQKLAAIFETVAANAAGPQPTTEELRNPSGNDQVLVQLNSREGEAPVNALVRCSWSHADMVSPEGYCGAVVCFVAADGEIKHQTVPHKSLNGVAPYWLWPHELVQQ